VTPSQDLARRRLYLCTPDRPDLAAFVEDCIAGGVDVVQLRDKQLEARPLLARARIAADVCRDCGVPFVLNDRPDLALAAGADGVHVGQEDVPVRVARKILGPDAIVGLSTHGPDDLAAAAPDVDSLSYISAGPVEPTPTKPGRPGTGLGYVTLASERSSLPVFVTGGVTPGKVPVLAAAGVRHFVAVRYLCEAPDARRAARALRGAIDRALSNAPTAA
jgi:thiamine-phosphate pyrophosphorylase